MTRLRLAIVIAAVSGGTAAHVSALAAGCVRAGMDVSAFAPQDSRPLFGPAVTFSPVTITDRPRPLSDLAVVRRLRRQWQASPPDVVHAHGVRAGAFAAAALAGSRGTRVRPALVVTVHNAPPQGQLNHMIYAFLERVCARRSDTVLCASSDLVARMHGLGARSVEQFDVPAALPELPSASAVAKAAADIGAAGRPIVLAVGRLAPQKGFDVLVAAAARWRQREPAPLTVIAGSGPLAPQLADQAGRGKADLLLLGDRRDVPALLAVCDVFVLPSWWEARALILQEAMRAGRPIVATRSGGTPELTGEDAAILVAPGDSGALSAAVQAVLDDAALAARLGQAARERASTFPTEEDALKHAEAVYYRVAANDPVC